MSAIKRSIRLIGSQKKTADLLGISQNSVWNWIDRGQASTRHIRAISRLTGGQITVDELVIDHEASYEKKASNS